jgi:hypothetical protein
MNLGMAAVGGKGSKAGNFAGTTVSWRPHSAGWPAHFLKAASRRKIQITTE